MFREIDILPPCFKTTSSSSPAAPRRHLGIGKAIAEKLLQAGATVAIAALNDDTLHYASEKFKPYGVDLSQESAEISRRS
jgi:NAD(P)-dependent dehydrogenase (short-subunit alcohol dehydrogenase family)